MTSVKKDKQIIQNHVNILENSQKMEKIEEEKINLLHQRQKRLK